MRTRGAVFVLPATTEGQQGPVAAWMSTAGWATAAGRVLGASWIVTPAGLLAPDELRRRGSGPNLSSTNAKQWKRLAPGALKTAVKDLREWRRARAFRVGSDGPWRDHDVAFVWQRHQLFHDAGVQLAEALGVPSVLFVPATLVWEAEQWGARRPGWGGMLERLGEARSLRRADVVACGSAEVAEQVLRLGVRSDAVALTPTGVDLDLFTPDATAGRSAVRAQLGLSDGFVVGWVGSFRRFHALELAVDAVAGVADTTLLLVGDGPERERIEQYAHRRRVRVVCTGTVAHTDLPAYLATMDAALLLAPSGRPFHYSPLKLAEYLASGLPVVVPDIPQLVARLEPGVDSVVVPAGDVAALASALRCLRDDPDRRRRLSAGARRAAVDRWSWDHAVHGVLAALSRLSP